MISSAPGHLPWLAHRIVRLPVREVGFWAVQVAVVGLAIAHLAVDVIWSGKLSSTPAGLPVGLILVPVGYAALRYGLSGSVPTALWATLLWLPDLFLPHDEGHAGNDATELALVVAVAVFVGYHIDMERLGRSQVRLAEIRHQAAEMRYQQLFDTNAAPILVLDRTGAVLEANPAARALLPAGLIGAPVGEILGRPLDALAGRTGSALVTAGLPPAGPRDYRVSVTEVPADSTHGQLTQLVLEDLTEERAEGRRIRHFAELLLDVQEDERRRIARELHDEPLQLLVHLARALDRLGSSRETSEPLVEGLLEARSQVLDIADRLRAVLGNLRPPALEQLGLLAALRGFLVDAGEASATRMELQIIGTETRLPAEIELGAFRIAQEAVNNALRHAGAAHLCLIVSFAAGHLGLQIVDDGRGFDPDALDRQPPAGRFGLLGMRERAALLGGRLTIRSAPGQGTTVEAELSTSPP